MIARRSFLASAGAFAAAPVLAHHPTSVPHSEVSRDSLRMALALPATITVGNPAGDVTMIEFFDYNCGFCKQATRDLDAILKRDPKLKVVLVNYAVLGLPSILAGKVAAAFAMQHRQKYLAFHKALFATRGVVDGERALAVAKQHGGDVDDLTEAGNSDAVTAVLKASAALGTRLNFSATPSYIFSSARETMGYVGHIPLAEKQAVIKATRTA
ncbi:MAG: DsbA family protein [Beijerinckiaceae bacterium]